MDETIKPIHVISLGAGVQSSTMALMAARGEVTPMPKAAIFADTGSEPPSVYAWLKWLIKQLPYPVHVVGRATLAKDGLEVRTSKKSGRVYLRSLIPLFVEKADGKKGILMRKCTRDYKITPIQAFQKELLGANFKNWRGVHKRALADLRLASKHLDPLKSTLTFAERIPILERGYVAYKECQDSPLVVQWIGISTDEVSRMKDSNKPWIVNRHPLIETTMSREDCFSWMKSHGFPKPPRSACTFCPYHSDAEWLRLKTEEPEAFADAVTYELACQDAASRQDVLKGKPFLHSSLIPLTRVAFNLNKNKRVMVNECEGICGV